MKIFRNIGLFFVVSLLILATGGVSIFHHFCHCAGEMSASVFLEVTCNHDHGSSSCCAEKEIPSCCKDKSEKESKHACHHDKCCQTSVQFVKIDDSFQPGLEKVSLKPFIVASALLYFDITEDVLSFPAIIFFNADLPPPDRGKQIVLALHQLKLDPNLV